MAFERNDTMLHKVAKNMILVFLILINGMIMLSCSQDKVKFENVEVEIKAIIVLGLLIHPIFLRLHLMLILICLFCRSIVLFRLGKYHLQ